MTILKIKSPFAGAAAPFYSYADHDEAGLANVWNSSWGLAHRFSPYMDWSTVPVLDAAFAPPGDVGRVYVSMNQNHVLIWGGNGDDVMVGGDFSDFLSGSGGSDYILGGAGSDIIDGGSGNDMLFGQEGGDTIEDGGGADKVFGGSGDDLIYSTGAGTYSGDGPDLFAGGTGNDWVSYGRATQGAIASLNDSTMNGGAAATDTFNSIENLIGSHYDDWLIGDGSANVLIGEDGNDTLAGNGGDDAVFGGNGDDYLFGDDGADFLDGGAGTDLLYAGAGNDTLHGGGEDRLFGEAGNDFFYNLAGGDLAAGGEGYDIVSLEGTASDWAIEDFGMVLGEDGVSETRLHEIRQLLADGSYDGRITLTGIEQLSFSDGSVLML
ncbi:MAG: hypothetical protein LCH38_12030 [Proteobacteria bacterium]|nr:hypothetical protein [Pseudomonadota bacterium]